MSNLFNINDSLIANYPWILVKILEGVDINSTHLDGFAEINVDNKFQGKYMSICEVLSEPVVQAGERLNAMTGDYACVWATGIEQFDLLGYGKVALIRNPDIYLRVIPGSELHSRIQARRAATASAGQ